MAEARPIRAHEAEPFLRLLCEVFGLDYGRARRVFFAEPLFDINRKWALVDGDDVLSILTTVPLLFGWGRAIGIAGVATREDRRATGHASELLSAVLKDAERRGEKGALLFARQRSLYERSGFQMLDEVIRSPIEVAKEQVCQDAIEFADVSARYNQWAEASPGRLRRDDRRWGYWRWNLRVCTPFGDGYLCNEAGVVRECVTSSPESVWPLPAGAEWFGLASVAKELGIPLTLPTSELMLMGRNVPAPPQLFMTDQF